jgi:hypothetical protein
MWKKCQIKYSYYPLHIASFKKCRCVSTSVSLAALRGYNITYTHMKKYLWNQHKHTLPHAMHYHYMLLPVCDLPPSNSNFQGKCHMLDATHTYTMYRNKYLCICYWCIFSYLQRDYRMAEHQMHAFQ